MKLFHLSNIMRVSVERLKSILQYTPAQSKRPAALVFLTAAVILLGGLGIGWHVSFSAEAQSADQVRIASGGKHIEFRGKKVLFVGDSVTQGWMELGRDFEQYRYLDALASRGINAVSLWAYIGITDQINDTRVGYDAPELWPWVIVQNRFDLTRFNDNPSNPKDETTYFGKLRRFVEYANGKNILVILTIHDGWTKGRWPGHPFNRSNGNGPLTTNTQYVDLSIANNRTYQDAFVDKLISAVGSYPNIMFEVFNEGEWYDQTKLTAHQTHFVDFIAARTNAPILINEDHVSGNFRSNTKVDVLSHHAPQWSVGTRALNLFGHYAPLYSQANKPILFSETVPEYLGDTSKRDALMRVMWGTLMASAGIAVQNDTSFGFNTRCSTNPSRCSMKPDTVLLDLEGHAARFFNNSGINLDNLIPNNTLCSSGVCTGTKGVEYIVYSETGTTFTVNLSTSSPTAYSARFYNPRTGTFEAAFTVSSNSASHTFTKPNGSSSDWVLHLVKSGAAVPTAVLTSMPSPTNVPTQTSVPTQTPTQTATPTQTLIPTLPSTSTVVPTLPPTSTIVPTQTLVPTATTTLLPPTTAPVTPTSTPVPTDIPNDPIPTPVPGAVSLIVNPQPAVAQPGGTMSVAIELVNAVELYGLEVQCVVNSQVLTGTEVGGGDGFNNTNSLVVDKGFSSADGSWMVAGSRLRPNPALSGNLTAFYLNYTVHTESRADITCVAAAADINGRPIPVTVTNGRFEGASPVPTLPPTNTPQPTSPLPTGIPTVTTTPTLVPTQEQPGMSTISGVMAYQSASDNAGITVELLSVEKTPLTSIITSQSGAYSFTDVPVGVYYVAASAPLHLPLLRMVMVESGGQVVELNTDTLSGGDTDSNQVIDLLDASLIGANYSVAVPPAPTHADINHDGLVDLRDLVIVAGNIGLTGPVTLQ